MLPQYSFGLKVINSAYQMGDFNDKNCSDNCGITFTARSTKIPELFSILKIVAWNAAFVLFIIFASINYATKKESCQLNCDLKFCSPFVLLIVVAVILYLGLFYYKVVKKYFGKYLNENVTQPCSEFLGRIFSTTFSRFILSMSVIALISTLIAFETSDDFHRLRSLVGIFSFIIIGYVFSFDKFAIKWRPVLCGFTLQVLLGVFCIRWHVGRIIFKCFSDKVSDFLHYSQVGASFVFGNFLVNEQFTFAFAALSTIFYFSFFISLLYYLGVMQWVLMNLGWILQALLGTTVCESINAAGNIFLGQSESPLIIRPYIKFLTHSEFHAIMVSGFSTVAGTVLAAYISFGAEAYHLITASVMAAPASLFFAKLFYPETEQSLTSSENIRLEKSSDSSLLDAASNGARNGISLFLNVIANLIAFVAFLAFADGVIKWAFHLLGYENVGIEFILGRIFIPVAYALGVEWEDCEAVGNVIGTKTFINEFVAYQRLGAYKRAGKISLRSSAIATYAICGFANPSSMGIMIGALSALAPERRKSITRVASRAFLAGSMVPLITASIAGLLMTDEMVALETEILLNATSRVV